MEALGILIGAGLAALSPLIPGLRPVTKAVIKGSMALADAASGVAVAAAAGWSGLTSEVATERTAGEPTIEEGVATPEGDAAAMSVADEAAPAVAAGVPAAAAVVAAGIPGEAPVEEEEPGSTDGTDSRQAYVPHGDDLTKINGIGPKVAALLHDAGITSFDQLAATDVETLHTILDGAGTRYRAVNPESWPEQAKMLGAGAG